MIEKQCQSDTISSVGKDIKIRSWLSDIKVELTITRRTDEHYVYVNQSCGCQMSRFLSYSVQYFSLRYCVMTSTFKKFACSLGCVGVPFLISSR